MRKVLGLLVVLCGIVSIAMTSRYGWKQADNEIDQVMSAMMFGTIALCAIIFDAVAIRLWVNRWRAAGFFIGVIACLAFVVTFSNSLGSILSRSDAVEAQRQNITDQRADNRRELNRLEDALARIGSFTPTDQAAVEAATRAANTATDRRKVECGENNEKRGPLCRLREIEDTDAAAKLATTTANKATTDRARDLEGQIAKVKAKLTASANVGSINPLAQALARIVPSLGDGISAMMQAAIALVFELCIIGMMVGFELLGHAAPARPDPRAQVQEPAMQEPAMQEPAPPVVIVPVMSESPPPEPKMVAEPKAPELPKMVVVPPPARPKLIAANPDRRPVGSVKRILTVHLESAPGDKVEIGDVGNRYRDVCRRDGKRTVTSDEFCTELDDFCRTVGITWKKAGEHVYLLDVRLASLAAEYTNAL
jgi:hypothetical protein